MNQTQPSATNGIWPEPCVVHVFTSKLTLHDLSFATAIATVCVVCWFDSEDVDLESVLVKVVESEVEEVTSAISGMPTLTSTVSPMAMEDSSEEM